MPFPRKYLHENEDVLLDLHPHWWNLAGPIALLALLLGAAVAVRDVGLPDRYPMLGMLALGAGALVWFVARYIRWANTNFVLTTDRIIHRQGVLSKQGREIPLERVNDITCHQSLFERVIGAGDLVIESGGERGQQLVSDIPRPFRVQNEIYRAIEDAQGRDAGRAAGARQLSVPEQIEKLDELRQRGVLSQAEFDVKKSQLLDRM
ncbi:MAG TPA: PH domain-containing protein [Acidimicrobiales bacterium]|nr:PH domain-containing protein [Acidimicrobiales bacterium]